MHKVAFIVKTLKPYRIPFFHLIQNMDDVKGLFIFDCIPGPYERMMLEENPISYVVLRTFILPSRFFVEKRYVRYFPINLVYIVNKFKPDIILCPEYSLNTLQAIFLQYFSKVRIIIWSSLTKFDERISFPFQNRLRNFLRKRANAFITYSDSSREYLIMKGVEEKKIFLVENCTDVKFFFEKYNEKKYNSSDKEFRLLYVGALELEKGILDLFHALKKLMKYNWKLTVAGTGSLKDHLIQFAKVNLDSRIVFSGEIDRKNLAMIYSNSEIFVCPSYSDVWGHVVDEAMACGCCVIASDKTIAARELIMHYKNGILFKAGEINLLKTELLNIFNNPSLIRILGKAAHDTMDTHNELYSVQGLRKAIEYVSEKR